MAKYYAVVRDNSPLMHYGIRGMHWGVRRAIRKGDKRAYDRQLRKANKKLAQLEKQVNAGMKYTRKALEKGAKASAAAGLVAMGIQNPSMLAYKAGVAGYNAYRAANAKRGSAAQKVKRWRDAMNKEFNTDIMYDAFYSTSNHKKRRKR